MFVGEQEWIELGFFVQIKSSCSLQRFSKMLHLHSISHILSLSHESDFEQFQSFYVVSNFLVIKILYTYKEHRCG